MGKGPGPVLFELVQLLVVVVVDGAKFGDDGVAVQAVVGHQVVEGGIVVTELGVDEAEEHYGVFR